MSSPSLRIPSSSELKPSDQVFEPSVMGIVGNAATNGSGRTRLTVPNIPEGDVREAMARAIDPIFLSMIRRSGILR